MIRRMLLQKLFDPIVIWLHRNGEHQLHNSFTIRLMSKPPAQGSDPVHGWVFFSACSTFQPPQDWFPSQQRHHFPAPLIAKRREERCEMGSDYYRLKCSMSTLAMNTK